MARKCDTDFGNVFCESPAAAWHGWLEQQIDKMTSTLSFKSSAGSAYWLKMANLGLIGTSDMINGAGFFRGRRRRLAPAAAVRRRAPVATCDTVAAAARCHTRGTAEAVSLCEAKLDGFKLEDAKLSSKPGDAGAAEGGGCAAAQNCEQMISLLSASEREWEPVIAELQEKMAPLQEEAEKTGSVESLPVTHPMRDGTFFVERLAR